MANVNSWVESLAASFSVVLDASGPTYPAPDFQTVPHNIGKITSIALASPQTLTYGFFADSADKDTYWTRAGGTFAFVEMWLKSDAELEPPGGGGGFINFRVENQNTAQITTFAITYIGKEWNKYSIDIRGGGTELQSLDNFGFQSGSYGTYNIWFTDIRLRYTYSVLNFSLDLADTPTSESCWGAFSTYKW